MQAFHSFWSKPNYSRNGGKIGFPDFELFTAILSALKWQELNGPIKLITDSRGAEFFDKNGLASLWDDTDVSLDQVDARIDPFLFWAAGKLYALKTMDMPSVMLDTDLIIWKNVDGMLDHDIIAAHREVINPQVYPDPYGFHLKEGYTYPKEWDFSVDAANTAFLCIKDPEFRDYYVQSAVDFFQNVKMDGLNPVTAMCFAEQRVLPMCAEARGKSLGYLLGLERAEMQDFVTHTWGFKQILRQSDQANLEFCMRCLKRILEDFPEKEGMIADCPQLKVYYLKYKELQ